MTLHAKASANLIEAIEKGDTVGAAQALSQGANPNARKKIVLTCKVSTGLFKHETRSDTALGESALALAVRTGNLHIAGLLLSAGVDPNWGEVVKIEPKPAMVSLLLKHGATVTQSVLEAYWALDDHELIVLLENAMMQRITALNSRVSELELKNEDLSKMVRKLQDKRTARAPSPANVREIVPMEEAVEVRSAERQKESQSASPVPPKEPPVAETPNFEIPALTLTEPTVVLGAPSDPKRPLNIPRRVSSAGAGISLPTPPKEPAGPEHRPDAEAERASRVESAKEKENSSLLPSVAPSSQDGKISDAASAS
ncbi:hypothetical protein HDU93_009400 [Gonapodya sp. JEL0774]|nr:hypothetical protein HDU93_009400 [Gonapodya sp. JEL0774]